LLNIFPDDKFQVYSRIRDAISSIDNSKIVDALEAASAIVCSRNISSDSESDITDTLNLVGQQIKWRRESGLVSSLYLISNIVAKTPQYLSDESDPINAETDTDMADRLKNRKAAAHLAYRLYRHFSHKGEKIPKVIADWRIICTSLNEFAEIRNEWMEAQ
jgi:hypothetical protein